MKKQCISISLKEVKTTENIPIRDLEIMVENTLNRLVVELAKLNKEIPFESDDGQHYDYQELKPEFRQIIIQILSRKYSVIPSD